MGGKRELRRCTSLMSEAGQPPEDHRKLTADLLHRAANLTKTVAQTHGPITIRIDVCCDDEDANPRLERPREDSGVGRLEGKKDCLPSLRWSPPRERRSPKGRGGLAVVDQHLGRNDAESLVDGQQRAILPSGALDGSSCADGPACSYTSASGPASSCEGGGRRLSPSATTRSPISPMLSRKLPSSPTASRRSPTFLEVPEESDLSLVKKVTVRLNLRTRTASFQEWRSRWLESAQAPPDLLVEANHPEVAKDGKGVKLTEERKERINTALRWLKSELREMQALDQMLARQLLSLRQDIHQLRLSKSCQQHRDLLDDLRSELEEQEELAEVLDDPRVATLNDTPLKQLGVTRMNLSARRFSTC